jgi:hypothetical protein
VGQHNPQRRRLVAQCDLIPSAIVAHIQGRVLARDVDLYDTVVLGGSKMIVLNAAAARDERRYRIQIASAWLGRTRVRLHSGADLTCVSVRAIRDEPRANSGSIEVGPLLPLCLTHDHRVVDGSAAAAFMAELLGLLESCNELNRRPGL